MNLKDLYNNAQHERYSVVYPIYMDKIVLNDWTKNDIGDIDLMYFTVDSSISSHLYERFTGTKMEVSQAEISIEVSCDDGSILAATIGKLEDDSVTDIDDIIGDFDLLKALVYREKEHKLGVQVSNTDAILAICDDDIKKMYNLSAEDDEVER